MKQVTKSAINEFTQKAKVLTKKECKKIKGGITNTEITDV